MLDALGSVISVIFTIALGFVLARRHWFDAAGSALVSRLVVSVSLPAYMVANLMGGYDRARLLSMLPGLPVPFLSMLILFGLSMLVVRLAKVRPGRRGTFSSMFSLSNTIFIGLPVNVILFGEPSIPFVLLFYMANTILFWTLGVHGIATDGAVLEGKAEPPLVSLDTLRRILSPPFLGLAVAIILILAGIVLPKPLLDLAKMIGGMTTPLSMLFIGIVIARVDWKTMRMERDVALVLLGRFVLAPVILVVLVRWTDLPLLMKQVFLVQAMMPAMTQTPILVAASGADAEYAGIATSLTTVLSLAVIPLCMVVVPLVF